MPEQLMCSLEPPTSTNSPGAVGISPKVIKGNRIEQAKRTGDIGAYFRKCRVPARDSVGSGRETLTECGRSSGNCPRVRRIRFPAVSGVRSPSKLPQVVSKSKQRGEQAFVGNGRDGHILTSERFCTGIGIIKWQPLPFYGSSHNPCALSARRPAPAFRPGYPRIGNDGPALQPGLRIHRHHHEAVTGEFDGPQAGKGFWVAFVPLLALKRLVAAIVCDWYSGS